MKKIFISILLFLFIFSFTACGNSELVNNNEGEITKVKEVDISIPKDMDLKVLEVRESFAFYKQYLYYIDIVVEDLDGQRYSLKEYSYYVVNDKYESLSKLVYGDYIRFDSKTNTLNFYYANSNTEE